MRRIAVFCFLLFSVVKVASAQNACETTLATAQAEFDAGRFHGVPGLLRECLERNQNREWRQRAYLLLAETYLLLENPVMADESFLNVLRANPEFETDETRDPIDLVYLSKRFTATPLFALYGRVGLNTTFARVIHDVKISTQSNVSESYSLKTGWQGGLGLDYNYSQKISFSAEMNYSFYSFAHKTKSLFLDGNHSLEFTDRQTWLNFPVMVKFGKTDTNLRPYCYLGYSANVLLRDRADMVIDGDTESPVFDYKYKRNSYYSSVVAGAGLKYKWGLRYIFGEVRYSMGLTNLTNPSTRYDQINQSWPYVDDDFKIDNLYVSIGYVHPFYKARKLKKAKTRSVLRKTKKTDEKVN